jgi:ankyrin repeat protein
MECLLKKNILDDVRSKQEFKALTPLDRAILKGSPEIVELLVEYGEELTGKHLEYSIKKNSVELVSLLLSLGQQATTKHIELATEKNNPEIIECLKLSLVQNDILQGYSDEDAMVIDNAQQEHPVEYIGASKEEV